MRAHNHPSTAVNHRATGFRRIHTRGTRACYAEMRAWQTALCQPALYVLLACMLFGFLLAVQLPLLYSVDVGVEEGYGGDLPLVRGFNTAEDDFHGTYRWTADKARIVMPGLGQRAVTLHLNFFPISAQVATVGPKVINLWIDETQLAVLPVRQTGATYLVHVPAALMHNGTLDVLIRTQTFDPPDPDDPRALGTPLNRITVTAPTSWPFAAPDWGAVVMWLLAAVFFWATILRTLIAVPRKLWWATLFLSVLVPPIVLAAILDPPRWSFGAQPAFISAASGYLLVLLLRPALAPLAVRLSIPMTAQSLGWLLLIIVVAYEMRYGGRLYPYSMHGDIGFHTNRFNEVVRGHVFLLSRNRGVNFPYPPGPYILLAPFALIRPAPPVLLELSAALVEAMSAPLIYTIVARALGKTPIPSVTHTALLAAAIYLFTAAGFMTTWWSFDTHIYAQFFTLLLITVVHDMVLRSRVTLDSAHQTPDIEQKKAIRDQRLPNNHPSSFVLRPSSFVGVFVLCSLVFLGHFGFFINTILLGSLMVLLLGIASWRGMTWARKLYIFLLLAGAGAGIVALALFYSLYIPLFLEQARVTATGGLTELAQRPPAERSHLWHVLWEAGFVQHFGFFPVLLAPFGTWLLLQRGYCARVTVALLLGSFLVSLVFALLPFITLSTQSTRWLMFSAWAIALSAAVSVDRLWRWKRSGQLVVIAMAGFVLWNTIMLWIGPMLWRIRPPEPF